MTHAVAVGFYTGEYSNLLRRIALDERVWLDSTDKSTFEEGFIAGGGNSDNMGPSWADHLQREVNSHGADTKLMVSLGGLETYQEVLFLRGEHTPLLKVLRAYTQALYLDLVNEGVGADDGTYDYFPDAVEAAYQLAKQITARWTYVSFVQRVEDTDPYKELVEAEEVNFPAWDTEVMV